jgi:hypothetical protein
MRLRVPLLAWLLCLVAQAAPAPAAAPQPDGIARLLQSLEKAIQSGDPAPYLDLLSPNADRGLARKFAETVITPGATRATVRERDRVPLIGALPGDGYSLALDVLTEFGVRGQLATWRVDVKRKGGSLAVGEEWGIQAQEAMSSIHGLFHLALNPTRQMEARNLEVKAEDFELRLPQGSVFIAETDTGPTALVILGRGEMTFTPAPATERGQIKIFAGSETLRTSFDAVLVRVRPSALATFVSTGSLTDRAVDPVEFARADAIFRADIVKSFTLNLSDITSDTWSLIPYPSDVVAEVHTRRFGTLTYAKSANEAEDITLFDRVRHRNLALYASQQKLATRGRFYDEDDLADYDVLHYDVDIAFSPDRLWIDGRTLITLRVRASGLSSLTLKLAETVAVRSVIAGEMGRVLAVPIRNQNTLVVNLPTTLIKGSVLRLQVTYAGRVEPQPIDREALEPQDQQVPISNTEEEQPPMEWNYLYSNRSYWYPQSPVSDYATATIRVTVPSAYGCVASGDPVSSTTTPAAGGKNVTTYMFEAKQPLRYLACIVSRFVPVRAETLDLTRAGDGEVDAGGARAGSAKVSFAVQSNPRQRSSGRQLASRASDIMRYYASLIGDCPYPSLTVAVVEQSLPGGHSPAYMVALSQPVTGVRFDWSRDPASLPDFPDFFIAHEIAHQWWGQGVGWKNYHEQWLSEGFAQYFAALYAARSGGPGEFDRIIRYFRRWSLQESAQGPIYLGYRVGHIKRDGRVFRAVVYNKSAAVLHMLRRLIGDDAFFRGIRRFYATWRFKKAGSDDLRQAFEAEAGQPLGRFFDRWIYDSALPTIRFTSRTEQGAHGPELVVRFQQVGEVFDLPITVTIDYADRPTENVIVPVTEQVTEKRIPLSGRVRRVDANRDGAALVNLK